MAVDAIIPLSGLSSSSSYSATADAICVAEAVSLAAMTAMTTTAVSGLLSFSSSSADVEITAAANIHRIKGALSPFFYAIGNFTENRHLISQFLPP